MKLMVLIIALYSFVAAVDPSYQAGFVSTNFAKADIEESKESSENISDNTEKSLRTGSAERRVMKTKGKETSFKLKPFVAVGLFISSAVTGYLGYDANEDAKFYHTEYENSSKHDDVQNNKNKISDLQTKRNMFYAISGASLAGVGITLTFF